VIAVPPAAGDQPHHHPAVATPELFRFIGALAVRGWPRPDFLRLIGLLVFSARPDLLLAPPTILLAQPIGGAVSLSVGFLPRLVKSLSVVVCQGFLSWLPFGNRSARAQRPRDDLTIFQRLQPC
jgi:hypothetical protein